MADKANGVQHIDALRRYMDAAKRALHNVETYAPPQTAENAKTGLRFEIEVYEAAIAALQGIEAAEQRVREVEALPAKWRESADRLELCALEADSIGLKGAADFNDERARIFRENADELERALTGSGSADNG